MRNKIELVKHYPPNKRRKKKTKGKEKKGKDKTTNLYLFCCPEKRFIRTKNLID